MRSPARTVTVATAAAACLVVPSPSPPPAAASARSATLTRSAHVAFEGCNARHVILSVTIARHTFAPAEQVSFTVRLRNTGSTTCGAPLAQHVVEAHARLTVGPCGSLPIAVHDAGGVSVYPGPATYFCPNEAGFRLGPRSTARATGSWNQSELLGTTTAPAKPQHAAPGTYQLVVDRAVTVPVALAPG
jgi:hypothetical protein